MSSAETDEGTEAFLSRLASASEAWSKFDLSQRVAALSAAAGAAREARDTSQVARKVLAASTKGLRRSVKAAEAAAGDGGASTTELAEAVKRTVKAYQGEIDNLTLRCKASDGAVSDLLGAARGLDDPAPLLRSGRANLDAKVGQIHHLLGAMEEMNDEVMRERERNDRQATDLEDLRRQLTEHAEEAVGGDGGAPGNGGEGVTLTAKEKEELIQLRREVAEYEVEFRSLKNQDITIRKLENKLLELERTGEEETQSRLEQARQELVESEGRRAAEALEREATAERRVAKLEIELRAERAGREATQTTLLEADEGAHAREADWEAQRQIFIDDSDRLRELLHEASRERDELRLKVDAVEGSSRIINSPLAPGTPGQATSPGKVIGVPEAFAERKFFEAEVEELTVMTAALRDELRKKEENMVKERLKMQTSIDDLQRERMSLAANVNKLQGQLDKAPSQEIVENMRRELRVLKSLEYNAEHADPDEETNPEMTPGVFGPSGESKTLEAVLAGKLKRVEADLVKERRVRSELADECETTRKELARVEKAQAATDALVTSLESDLERAIQSQRIITEGNSEPQERSVPVPIATAQSDPATLQHVLDGSDPPLPTPSILKTEAPLKHSSSESEKVSDDRSVTAIIMAQRDRLRARCDSLEAERDSFKRELQMQVAATESLKSDNTKLYEKVRYLQNYSSSSGVPRSRVAVADRDLDLEALEQRYEASVDPFRQFGRAERQRKLNDMSPAERIVFLFAKIVLGTKEMRTLLFFYMLGMHLLVFITTYHWSHEMGCHELIHHEDVAHMHGGVPFENVKQGLGAAAQGAAGN